MLKIFHLSISMLLLFIAEWISRRTDLSVTFFNNFRSLPLRWSMYLIIIMMIILFKGEPVEFIYFAF